MRLVGIPLLLFSLVSVSANSACASGASAAPPQASPATSPSPTAGPPVPAGAEATATFGAVQAIRALDSVQQLIYEQGEDPANKRFGLAGGTLLTVNGRVYAIHFDYEATAATLKLGDTVNLHPTDWFTIIKADDGSTITYRLMKVFKNSREIPPLQPF